jgi:hypothetical protein
MSYEYRFVIAGTLKDTGAALGFSNELPSLIDRRGT